ncbi:MAG: MBL fold metallo-hydrolase [Rhodospirillales bacterium]
MNASVIQITNGPMKQNCYLVYDDHSALIIDPGSEAERIVEQIECHDLQPLAILNTHAHFDHIGAVEALRLQYDIPFYLHDGDVALMRRANLYRLIFSGETSVRVPTEVRSYCNLEATALAPFDVKVIETPGHTEGGVSLLIDDALFTGDTLMCNGPGRTDLPGGCKPDMAQSLLKYQSLPPYLTIYAGHGRPVSLGTALSVKSGAEA